MKKITNFKDLEIWQMGMRITNQVYSLTKSFPQSETFGLTNQMRRSAVSIVSNIAEGFNRYHNPEYRQFLYIALGSCAELETQVEISLNQGYISAEVRNKVVEDIICESRMMRNLIKKLNISIQS